MRNKYPINGSEEALKLGFPARPESKTQDQDVGKELLLEEMCCVQIRQLPLYQRRCPCETTSKCLEEDVISIFYPSGHDSLIKGYWD